MPIDENIVRKEIGRRVAAARRSAGLTQEALAEKLDVNLVTVSRLERGHSLPGVVGLLRICEAVALPPAVLFDLPIDATTRKSDLARAQRLLRAADDDDLRLVVAVIDRITPRRKGAK